MGFDCSIHIAKKALFFGIPKTGSQKAPFDSEKGTWNFGRFSDSPQTSMIIVPHLFFNHATCTMIIDNVCWQSWFGIITFIYFKKIQKLFFKSTVQILPHQTLSTNIVNHHCTSRLILFFFLDKFWCWRYSFIFLTVQTDILITYGSRICEPKHLGCVWYGFIFPGSWNSIPTSTFALFDSVFFFHGISFHQIPRYNHLKRDSVEFNDLLYRWELVSTFFFFKQYKQILR